MSIPYKLNLWISNTGIQDSSTATSIFLACYSLFKVVTQALATLQVTGRTVRGKKSMPPPVKTSEKSHIIFLLTFHQLKLNHVAISSCKQPEKLWVLTGFTAAPNKIRDPLMEKKRRMDMEFVPTQEVLLQCCCCCFSEAVSCHSDPCSLTAI